QHGFDPRLEFFHAHRQGHIVVGSEVEALHRVAGRVVAREQDDRRGDARPPGFAQDVEAVFFRQPYFELDDVVRGQVGHLLEGHAAVFRTFYPIADGVLEVRGNVLSSVVPCKQHALPTFHKLRYEDWERARRRIDY